VVAFDPDKRVLTKTRHAWIVSPPHTVCTAPSAYEERAPPGFVCPTQDSWWLGGRRLFRRVHRIAVNHDTSSPKYGDAWFCGEHATFAALLNNGVEQRNMYDRTAAFPYFADAYDTWEHLHPALHDATNSFINAACWGLSIAPDGTPWASNQYRTAWVGYPGSDLSNDNFGMSPYVTPTTCPAGSTCAPYAGYDIWPDPPDAASFSSEYYGSVFDGVLSLSHCPDGTLWVGSFMHGLARIDTSGGITNDFGHSDPILRNPIQTVACDPLDSSVWIGFQNGQLGRFRNGAVELVDTTGAPDFAKNVVQSIQIDRWATNSRRIVYFAFGPNTDAIGNITAGGGVAAYAGP